MITLLWQFKSLQSFFRKLLLISIGCSGSSESSLKGEKVLGNTFCKSSYQCEGFYEDYEEQDVSIWIDLEVEGMHFPYAHTNIVF